MRQEKKTAKRYHSLITTFNIPGANTKTLVTLVNGAVAKILFRKELHRMIGRMPPMPTIEDLA